MTILLATLLAAAMLAGCGDDGESTEGGAGGEEAGGDGGGIGYLTLEDEPAPAEARAAAPPESGADH